MVSWPTLLVNTPRNAHSHPMVQSIPVCVTSDVLCTSPTGTRIHITYLVVTCLTVTSMTVLLATLVRRWTGCHATVTVVTGSVKVCDLCRVSHKFPATFPPFAPPSLSRAGHRLSVSRYPIYCSMQSWKFIIPVSRRQLLAPCSQPISRSSSHVLSSSSSLSLSSSCPFF